MLHELALNHLALEDKEMYVCVFGLVLTEMGWIVGGFVGGMV